MDNQEHVTCQVLLARLWLALGGPAQALEAARFSGRERGLPSIYEVSTLASASVAAATLAVAELQAARAGRPLRAVHVQREHADAAFLCERHLRAVGWKLPDVWDPLAGDYPTRDGFIRLHTNYTYHRDAALQVLALPLASATRELVAQAVLTWSGDELEEQVVAAGGCAAVMRSPEAWQQHPQGKHLAQAAVFDIIRSAASAPSLPDITSAKPLTGVRVLDLTRVIAGPIGTRFLSAYGADVLRVDPPGFQEVAALLCDVTAGKRRCALDLREQRDRERFLELVEQADVIVHGYRSTALQRLGLGTSTLRERNPNAVIVCHDAYGWDGPWAGRRGFDSLVQMSCGIAWRGLEVTSAKKPVPLPAQALDHATGYLIAAAVCRSLTERASSKQASIVRLSLARTARLLMELGDLGAIVGEAAGSSQWMEQADTAFGKVSRVRCPGSIEGQNPSWEIPAGNLGVDAPSFI